MTDVDNWYMEWYNGGIIWKGILERMVQEPKHKNTYKMTGALRKDTDQPVLMHSLIRIFRVRMMKHCILADTYSS